MATEKSLLIFQEKTETLKEKPREESRGFWSHEKVENGSSCSIYK